MDSLRVRVNYKITVKMTTTSSSPIADSLSYRPSHGSVTDIHHRMSSRTSPATSPAARGSSRRAAWRENMPPLPHATTRSRSEGECPARPYGGRHGRAGDGAAMGGRRSGALLLGFGAGRHWRNQGESQGSDKQQFVLFMVMRTGGRWTMRGAGVVRRRRGPREGRRDARVGRARVPPRRSGRARGSRRGAPPWRVFGSAPLDRGGERAHGEGAARGPGGAARGRGGRGSLSGARGGRHGPRTAMGTYVKIRNIQTRPRTNSILPDLSQSILISY